MASDLNHGPGSKLWTYWTKGEGAAKWTGAIHKWTTLRDLLLKAGVPPADGGRAGHEHHHGGHAGLHEAGPREEGTGDDSRT